jgi:hypothetical protein
MNFANFEESSILMFCLIASTFASCSAVAGCIAYHKRRSPLEGVFLGLILGPIGVILECRLAYVQRPPVDKNAWNSLHSMMTYQQTRQESRTRRSRSS